MRARIDVAASQLLHVRLHWLVAIIVLGANTFQGLRILVVARRLATDEDVHKLGFIPLVVASVPAQVVAIFFYVFPALISRRSLRVLYLCIVAREVSYLMVPGEAHSPSVTQNVLISVGIRVIMCFVQQDPRFFAGVHVAVVALCMGLYVSAMLPGEQGDYVGPIAWMNLWMWVVAVLSERGTRAAIKTEIEAATCSHMNKAALQLLSSVCDAVVHLSEKFEIQAGDQRLAALLLTQDVLLGRDFCDMICDDENKAAFKSFMQQPCEGFAGAVSIGLLDVNNMPVRVQLLHTLSLDVDRRPVHILGLSDVGANERQVPASAAAASAVDSVVEKTRTGEHVTAAAPSSALFSISEDSASDFESCHSALGCQLPNLNHQAQRSGKAQVLVEPVSLRLQSWTPAMLDLFGPSALSKTSCFLDWVVQSQRMQFLQRFQDLTQDLMDDPDIDARFDVVVRSLHGVVRLHGSLKLEDGPSKDDLQAEGEEDDPWALPLVALTFFTVTKLRKKERRRQLDYSSLQHRGQTSLCAKSSKLSL